VIPLVPCFPMIAPSNGYGNPQGRPGMPLGVPKNDPRSVPRNCFESGTANARGGPRSSHAWLQEWSSERSRDLIWRHVASG